MYLQLLDEAVREERGEKDVHKAECLVDVRINAFIPENYISNQAQRVDCYRKIARVKTEEDALDMTDELIDRFGEPPESVVGLIEVARVRNLAAECGISEITQVGEELTFFLSKIEPNRLASAGAVLGRKMRVETVGKPRFTVVPEKNQSPLEVIKTAVTAMAAEK